MVKGTTLFWISIVDEVLIFVFHFMVLVSGCDEK